MFSIRDPLERASELIGDLARRRVYRIALVYLGLAVGAIEIAVNLETAAEESRWLRIFLIVIAAGFPVAVGLGWFFDITDEGIRRTPDAPSRTQEDSARSPRERSRPSTPALPDPLLTLAGQATTLESRREPGALKEALAHWERVTREAPGYAPGHAGHARVLTLLVDAGAAPRAEALAFAKESARRAIDLDPDLSDGHAALAFAGTVDWDWRYVAESFRRAVELGASVSTLRAFALFRAAAGDAPGALRAALQAREADPESPMAQSLVAAIRYYAREPDRAVAEARAAIEGSPESPFPHLILALAEEARGHADAATAALKAGMTRSGTLGVLVAGLGHVQASAGDSKSALRTLEALRREDGPPVPPFAVAALEAALGEVDASFDSLRRGVGEHDGWMLSLRVHPWMDPVREDPRFATILREVGPPTDDTAGRGATTSETRGSSTLPTDGSAPSHQEADHG